MSGTAVHCLFGVRVTKVPDLDVPHAVIRDIDTAAHAGNIAENAMRCQTLLWL